MKRDQFIVTIVGGTKDEADFRVSSEVPDGWELVNLYSRREVKGDRSTKMVRTYTFEPAMDVIFESMAETQVWHD